MRGIHATELGHNLEILYNDDGRPSSVVDPAGNRIEYSYGGASELV